MTRRAYRTLAGRGMAGLGRARLGEELLAFELRRTAEILELVPGIHRSGGALSGGRSQCAGGHTESSKGKEEGKFILHPWPSDRFAVTHPRWEPYAESRSTVLCGGRDENRVPTVNPREGASKLARSAGRGSPRTTMFGVTSSERPRNDHANREWSGYLTARMMVKSVLRRAMLRVQRRAPGQRVAKNHDVRRQLRRPRSFPLSQNLVRCCTKHCNRVAKLRLFHAQPPKSTHP